MDIEFTIDGEAQAQGRPRAGKTRYGKTIVYDPDNSRNYKEYVRMVASQHKPTKPLTGCLDVEIVVYKTIPKSMAQYKAQEARDGTRRPTTKPDIDNVVKGITDAMNSIIYKDDSQIVSLRASKFYSDSPRVEVTVKETDHETS